MEKSCGGCVIEWVGSCRVDSGPHVVAAVRLLVGGQQEVNGLTRGYCYVVCDEWFGVACIRSDNGEAVVGDGEEENVLED